jgi:hypothetical protein
MKSKELTICSIGRSNPLPNQQASLAEEGAVEGPAEEEPSMIFVM